MASLFTLFDYFFKFQNLFLERTGYEYGGSEGAYGGGGFGGGGFGGGEYVGGGGYGGIDPMNGGFGMDTGGGYMSGSADGKSAEKKVSDKYLFLPIDEL